jgi:glycosyltransferase involved in cell wall biosynthesis
VKKVLPTIRLTLPEIELTIAGSNPTPEILLLKEVYEGIKVTGHITDQELARLYESARISVAPLRFGAGVKGKVLESLMKGLPMVTTSIGIQGLENPSCILLHADDAKLFAEKVINLYQDPLAWKQQRESGLDFFRKNYTEEVVLQSLKKWLPKPKPNHATSECYTSIY